MKAHYLAICRSRNGSFFLSNHLYASEIDARKEIGEGFVRLATDLAPVMLQHPAEPKVSDQTIAKIEKHNRRFALK